MKSFPWMICSMAHSDLIGNVDLTYFMLISVIIWICLGAYFFLRMPPLLFMRQTRNTCSVPLPIPWIQRHTTPAILSSMFSCVLRLCKNIWIKCYFPKACLPLLSCSVFASILPTSPVVHVNCFPVYVPAKENPPKLLLHQSRPAHGDVTASYAVDVRDYGYAMYKYSV
jgi:hypothetical protein